MRWLAAGLVCLAAGIPAPRAHTTEAKPVVIRVSPLTAQAPATVRATTWVERDDANRALTVSATCPDYLRRSTMPLEGASAARKHVVLFESLPACEYEIRATVHRQNGDTIEDVQGVIITR